MRPRDGKDGSDHGAENGLEEGEGKREGWSRNDGVRSKTNNGEGEKGRVSRNNRSEERRSSGVGRNSGFHERYMASGRNTINDSLGRASRLPVNFCPNFARPPPPPQRRLITDSGHTRADPRNRKSQDKDRSREFRR